jgi:hypothetical protein
MPSPLKNWSSSNFRRELRVGVDAVERSVELDRNLALQLYVADIALQPQGTHRPGEAGIAGKMCQACLSIYSNNC